MQDYEITRAEKFGSRLFVRQMYCPCNKCGDSIDIEYDEYEEGINDTYICGQCYQSEEVAR